MSQPPGHFVLAIIRALTEFERMTARDMARQIAEYGVNDKGGEPVTGDVLDRRVSSTLSRMNKASGQRHKRVYVCDWVHEAEVSGERMYPRAVYALGDKPNKAKPKPDSAAASLRYRIRNQWQVASVFHLANFARARRVTVKVKE